ncbi:uncharacterized protein CPUR_00709 [Claviceps purpurea 20.1]|uniref:Chorismate synthase protein n=1 Tax=Claviceps purpurea (strain 20.1) TaxID=1111077 RepID=M1VU66_CLAP2|nr:uncharacterized protein CPUR_00709 [Claviceps purpurea 20.1]
MALVSWESFRSILLCLGPFLLPKAISLYRSLRVSSLSAQGLPIQPIPPRARIALGLLFALCSIYLVQTLSFFAPENLFLRTQSRLQIPVDVLFNRVSTLRPDNALTQSDLALRAKFVNLKSRLLYIQFGPSVLADCPFCNVDEPNSYFYYALPSILWTHLANLVVTAIVTSSAVTGKEGSQWRSYATISGITAAALDAYLVRSYDSQANARQLRLTEVDFFYWSMRIYRLLGLCALNGLLGWVLYLSCTNRAFVRLPSPAERITQATSLLSTARSRLSAMGIINNTAMRDEELRGRSEDYWTHETNLMRGAMEQREVVEGVNDALSARINIDAINKEAETYTEGVLNAFFVAQKKD